MAAIKPKVVKDYNFPRLDAAQNVFFARELEEILLESYDIKYAALRSKQFIRMNTSIPIAKESVTYRQYDSVGQAKLIQDLSSDVPMVNLFGTEVPQAMKSYGLGYGYSVDEIAAAQSQGLSLDRERAEITRKGLAQTFDDVMFNGDSGAGLKGLLTLTGTDTFTPATKAAGGTSWMSGTDIVATPQEMLADLNGMWRQIFNNTLEVEIPNQILLPTLQYTAISETRLSDASDTTVLRFFLNNHPGVSIDSSTRLAGAGTAGADLALCYVRDVVQGLVATEFQAFPPEPKNMAFRVNCRMKIGGVICPYPKGVAYASGI